MKFIKKINRRSTRIIKGVELVKTNIKELKERKKKLLEVGKRLKRKFVGLDHIIDSITNNLTTWYVMPELMERPTIINLWGLTGVGKTDLVRTLVRELEYADRFLEIQLKTINSSYYTIQNRLEDSGINFDSPAILLLDEIQRFRTKDKSGNDVNSTGYDDIWQLLSDGKFPSNSQLKESLTEMLFNYLDPDKQDDDEEDTDDDTSVGKGPAKKKKKKKIDYWIARRIKRLLNLTDPIQILMEMELPSLIELIQTSLQTQNSYETKPFSKLLIFISGNLDEAFTMAGAVGDATADANIYHEFSKTINIINIKEALLKRFNPEQISRFGNTHIIYPSLSKDTYKKIITKNLSKIIKKVKQKHGIKLKFDKSINKVIYSNGVFPTQGARPTLSTIGSMIEATIPNFLIKGIEQNVSKIEIGYEKNNLYSNSFKGKKFEHKVETALDNIKKEVKPDEKISIAVHEAGHAVIYAYRFGVAPLQIVCDSTHSDDSGFVSTHKMHATRQVLTAKIDCLLAGLCAEKIVFGDNNIGTGATSDIKKATYIAGKMLRKYGLMGSISYKIPAELVSQDPSQQGANFDLGITNEQIDEFISSRQKIVEELLKGQKPLFKIHKEVSKLLAAHGDILPKKLVNICKKNGLDIKTLHPKELLISPYVKLSEDYFENKESMDEILRKNETPVPLIQNLGD